MSETTARAELIPEYSAEQIADNYPVRKVEMLSGPYMPAYRARARFEADAARIAENEETIEQLSENLKIAARAHGVLEAEIARLKELCDGFQQLIGTGQPEKYRECIRELEALVDDMLIVARKVGNGMPILTDAVIQRMARYRASSLLNKTGEQSWLIR